MRRHFALFLALIGTLVVSNQASAENPSHTSVGATSFDAWTQLREGEPVTIVSVMAGQLASPLADALRAAGHPVKIITGEHTWGHMTPTLHAMRPILNKIEGRMIMLGYSFGGRVAMRLGVEYADKIVGTALMAPQIKTLHVAFKQSHGGDKAKNYEDFVARGGKSLGSALAHPDFADYDEWAQESGIKKPTVVFHGTKDELISPRYIEQIAKDSSNPGVKAVFYEGIGHGFSGQHIQHMVAESFIAMTGQQLPAPIRVAEVPTAPLAIAEAHTAPIKVTEAHSQPPIKITEAPAKPEPVRLVANQVVKTPVVQVKPRGWQRLKSWVRKTLSAKR